MTVTSAASLTRPADTTAYTALDVVSDSTSAPTVLQFANLARVNGESGYITRARLATDQKTNTARHRLHLYHTAPTAINDNSAFGLLWANRDKYVGAIDFPAASTEDATASSSAHATNATVRLPFVCAFASRTLYGVLETLDAYTPTSAQNYFIELTAEQN